MTIVGMLTKGVTDPEQLFDEAVDWIVLLKSLAQESELRSPIPDRKRKEIIELLITAKADIHAMTTPRYRKQLTEELFEKEARGTMGNNQQQVRNHIDDYVTRIIYVAQVMAQAFATMKKEMQEKKIITYYQLLDEIKNGLVFPFIQLLQPDAPRTVRQLAKLAA